MAVISVLILLLLLPFVYEFDDGKHLCMHRDSSNVDAQPKFSWNTSTLKHENTGGKACLSDIVEYANALRAGEDKLVDTDDDTMDLDTQLSLVYDLIQQEFPGAYWIDGKWHFNHNAGVSGQMKLLYADINEYLLFFGAVVDHGGYAGCYNFNIWDAVLQGNHYTQDVGKMKKHVYTPTPDSSKEYNGLVTFLPKGQQKIYRSQGKNGAILLEYGHGHIASSFLRSIVVPNIFMMFDFRSLWYSLSGFGYSCIRNILLRCYKFTHGMQHSKISDTTTSNPSGGDL